MAPGPDDPVTQLAAGAAAMHELFTAHVAAGFQRSEALQIVIALMTANLEQQQQPPEED